VPIAIKEHKRTEWLISSFYPRQLGVGVASGYEAAIHSARCFMQNMPNDYVVVKLDFQMLSVVCLDVRCWLLFWVLGSHHSCSQPML